MPWEDSYLGQLRSLAGNTRTLLFVGARCVVRDDDHRVLLIRRRDNGRWGMPAGAMELGESIAQCAAREMQEETGLLATALTAFATHSGAEYTDTNQYGHTYQVFTTLFRVDVWHGELLGSTDETIDAGFFVRDRLPEPLTASIRPSLADLDSFEQTGRFVTR
jgi:8-oxo-dGTP pyrophosphatase MutT (NUDIX family)